MLLCSRGSPGPRPPRGHSAKSRNSISCHKWGDGATGISWAEVQDAVSIVQHTGRSHNKERTNLYATSAQVEKPCATLTDLSETEQKFNTLCVKEGRWTGPWQVLMF